MFLANALKADRNHKFIRSISLNDRQISLIDGQISLYAGQISFNAGTHRGCGFRHKVKSAHQRNQQLTRTIPALNEIFVRHNVKFSYSFRS